MTTQARTIPTEIRPSVERIDLSPAKVTRDFHRLLDSGARFRAAGLAGKDPQRLLALDLAPKHKIELFDTHFYITNLRQIPELRFYVAYVVQPASALGVNNRSATISPRIFYKDLSLVWRSASHFSDADGLWIGKGDTYDTIVDGYEVETSQEATTDLPSEMQSALESLLPWVRRVRGDGEIIELVLRRAGGNRIRPFEDFSRPRERAHAIAANRIHGGRSIARFTRKNDPSSLRFAKGFEPDFGRGVLERSESRSSLYGGKLRRFRILSTNRKIQYGFIAGPKHIWIIPPQATTTELSSYGVRTVDVVADDDLFVPGYEFHYIEDDGTPYSQIPEGYAGGVCPHDEMKADASPWLNALPVVRELRRKLLR